MWGCGVLDPHFPLGVHGKPHEGARVATTMAFLLCQRDSAREPSVRRLADLSLQTVCLLRGSRLQSISAVGRVEDLRLRRESRGHPEWACQNRAHFHRVFPCHLQACCVLGK